MTTLKFKKQEAKTITFNSTTNGETDNLTGGEFSFIVKKKYKDNTPKILKETSDFDITDVSTGIIKLLLTTDDLNLDAGNYKAELKIILSETNIDKSNEIDFIIEDSLF